MTPVELATQALAHDRAATKGPWHCEPSWNNTGIPLSDFSIPGHNSGATVEMMSVDAHFIVAARFAMPALAHAVIDQTKELERFREENAALREDGDLRLGAWQQSAALGREIIQRKQLQKRVLELETELAKEHAK